MKIIQSPRARRGKSCPMLIFDANCARRAKSRPMSIFSTNRARRGTTLIELLAAVIVLVVFGMIVNTGLNLVLNSYHTMTSEAETQLLLSTAADAITDELRYARSVETESDGMLKEYISETFGYYCNIVVDDKGQLVIQEAGMDQPLLSSGVYGRDSIYSVELPEGIKYKSDTGIFSFKLGIKEKDETKAEAEFQVYCLSFVPETEGGA